MNIPVEMYRRSGVAGTACGIDPTADDSKPVSIWEFSAELEQVNSVNKVLKFIAKDWFPQNEAKTALAFDSIDQVTDKIATSLAQILQTEKEKFSCEAIPDDDGNIQSANSDESGLFEYSGPN